MNKKSFKYPSLITLILGLSINISNISAQQASESAIQSIREAVQTKIQDQNTKKLGFIGQILEINNNNLKVSVDGKEWTVINQEDTTIEKIPGKKKINLSEVTIQDFAIIIGTNEANKQLLNAELIQIIPTPEFPDREIANGLIESIDKQTITIQTTSDTSTIKLTNSTKIYNQSSPSAQLKTSELKTNQQITATGNITNPRTKDLTASIIIIEDTESE